MLNFSLLDEKLKTDQDIVSFSLDKDVFLEAVIYFKVHQAYLFLLDYNISKQSDKYLVKVVLKNLEIKKLIILETFYFVGDILNSLKGIWPSANGFERRLKKHFDLKFNSFDEVNTVDAKKLELDFDIGHQYPDFFYEVEEEKLSYFKIESNTKFVPHKKFHSIQALQELSHFNPKDSINTEISYCMAVENSLGVNIPEKAQAIRMIFSELQRIVHHLEFLIHTHIALKDFPLVNELINFRRKVYDLYAFYTGKEFNISFNYIGGVSKDIPSGWIPMCSETLKVISNSLERTYQSKIQNSLWNQKFSRFEVSAKALLGFSVSGPNLRAGGINYDLRKNTPYYFYEDIDFEVPIGIWGTSFDRFLCRLEEIHQSVKIVLQVLDNLPYGEIYAKDERLIYNLQKDLSSTTKQNIYHELLVSGDKLSEGCFMGLIESPRGSTGFILDTKEGNTSLHYMGAHAASLYALESNLIGLHRHYLEREIASYGLHPWERN